MDAYTIVERYRDSDSPYMMPEKISEEFADILRAGQEGLPIVHQLKEFIQNHPEYIAEAGQELAIAYYNKNDLPRAMATIEKVLQHAPDFIHAITLKIGLLIEKEDFDAVESFINLDKDFAFHFPQRKKVSVVELAEYEFVGIGWKLVNEETEEAITRSWNLISTLKDYTIETDFLARLHDRFLEYIPEEEYTPALDALLDHLEQMVIQGNSGPNLNHPESMILAQQVLVPGDYPKVEQLFSLPEASFKNDLYALIDYALAQSVTEKETADNATHQVWLSMLILAGMDDEKFADQWIEILSSDGIFIEIWLGAELQEELFYVGYRAGIHDPGWLASKIDLDNFYYKSNLSLVTSLCMIAWTHPEKKTEVLNLVDSIVKQLLAMSEDEQDDDTRFLVAGIMEQAAALDYNWFKNDILQAVEKDLLDEEIVSPERTADTKLPNYSDRYEYGKLIEPIKEKLKRVWLDE